MAITNPAKIGWHYMWSQDYAFFHNYLQDSIKESEFVLKPTFIDQSVFDRGLYTIKTEDRANTNAWQGCLIKVDYLIDLLKTTAKESPLQTHIFFTDADIIVKPGIYNILKPYIDAGTSMTFLKEGGHLNIGCMLLKVCPEVVEFWELVKAKVIENPKHLDQGYVNDMIAEYSGTWLAFDKSHMVCSNEYKGNPDCLLLQILSSNIGKEFHVAEKLFFAAQLGVDMEKYMKYVPEHIIPYIYKFQDMLAKHRKSLGSA
jgi:hypothetical protein